MVKLPSILLLFTVHSIAWDCIKDSCGVILVEVTRLFELFCQAVSFWEDKQINTVLGSGSDSILVNKIVACNDVKRVSRSVATSVASLGEPSCRVMVSQKCDSDSSKLVGLYLESRSEGEQARNE